jgi:hypothetical protein
MWTSSESSFRKYLDVTAFTGDTSSAPIPIYFIIFLVFYFVFLLDLFYVYYYLSFLFLKFLIFLLFDFLNFHIFYFIKLFKVFEIFIFFLSFYNSGQFGAGQLGNMQGRNNTWWIWLRISASFHTRIPWPSKQRNSSL